MLPLFAFGENPVGTTNIGQFQHSISFTAFVNIRCYSYTDWIKYTYARRSSPAGIIYVKIVSIFNTTRRKHMTYIICILRARRLCARRNRRHSRCRRRHRPKSRTTHNRRSSCPAKKSGIPEGIPEIISPLEYPHEGIS